MHTKLPNFLKHYVCRWHARQFTGISEPKSKIIHNSFNFNYFKQCCVINMDNIWTNYSIGGSRGHAWSTPSLQDPVLSFPHTFSPKSARVGGPRPLTGPHHPTGNPESASVFHKLVRLYFPISNLFSSNSKRSG